MTRTGERLRYYSVFQLTEAEVDEETLLGPTYRLVCNVEDHDGRWQAKDAHAAIRKAARRRDGIYAAVPSDTLVVDRWPLAILAMAGS